VLHVTTLKLRRTPFQSGARAGALWHSHIRTDFGMIGPYRNRRSRSGRSFGCAPGRALAPLCYRTSPGAFPLRSPISETSVVQPVQSALGLVTWRSKEVVRVRTPLEGFVPASSYSGRHYLPLLIRRQYRKTRIGCTCGMCRHLSRSET
jgi:hypothetical protein